ncbi:MAG: primosomal protein N' [Bacteroidales bacterium]|nr:primosomal protein N' [Bacteroidales bacterium]MCI2122049.1 primosomal protein N' [Bacteroidales bacterium]MCI2145346.1 primosomal protein N' [Bacteroidales bacterium]
MYANIILPLKLAYTMSYSIPGPLERGIRKGSWVTVTMHFRRYLGIVEDISYSAPEGIAPSRIKPIDTVEPIAAVSYMEIEFWKTVAEYYMCTVGEVFKAAYSGSFSKQIEYLAAQKELKGEEGAADRLIREERENRRGKTEWHMPVLSDMQAEAVRNTEKAFAAGRSVLLNGVTGSGKTEVYITLAIHKLLEGKQVLYMAPEIAMSKQLCGRLKNVFGESLMIFHSRQTSARKKQIFNALKNDSGSPHIILGTRSAVFLPFENLGLVIVDEEHDSSYKQEDPAPRYNGRDTALMLARQLGANVILGSATPSLESFFNVRCGKFAEVRLPEKYYGEKEPEIEIVDTIRARHLHDMKGSFSNRLVNEIAFCIKNHEQVLVFRSRRSYSPVIQCSGCGEVLKCPNCNVNLSYHKYSETVSCHYCGYSAHFNPVCPSCGAEALVPKGAGTEKLEEELKSLFPEAAIERFDADVFRNKTRSDAILKDFASGKTDILVGTQMITKGFDFENLALVAVISGDSLLSFQDFRNDERATELLYQLRGRAGRRKTRGKMLVQTDHSSHPVFKSLSEGSPFETRIEDMMTERSMFNYPPCSRMIRIISRDEYEGRLLRTGKALADALSDIRGIAFTGPVAPERNRLKNLYISEIWIKLQRTPLLRQQKAQIASAMESVRKQLDFKTDIFPDVDPL